jgi:hypothetical protein
MPRLMLLRYDTEAGPDANMRGFFEKVVKVHRRDAIPATFFCTGRALETRTDEFRDFHAEVKNDPLFDLQDHSYSHIGVGYAAGKDLETLRADYAKSFAAHERVFGRRPLGVSLCGTGGVDGARLRGFDETEKARAEFEMLAALGVRMVNTFLKDYDESRAFVRYGALGHPEVMGFPSGHSDTDWLFRGGKPTPGGIERMQRVIEERAQRDEHCPIILHDWNAWNNAPDRELGHVRGFAERARKLGYRLVTHVECLRDESL